MSSRPTSISIVSSQFYNLFICGIKIKGKQEKEVHLIHILHTLYKLHKLHKIGSETRPAGALKKAQPIGSLHFNFNGFTHVTEYRKTYSSEPAVQHLGG